MSKFKVGDIIKATADSDSEYLITCKKRGWTGIVVGIGDYGKLKVRTITPIEQKGNIYEVNRRYFVHNSKNNIDDHWIEGNVITVTLDNGRKGIAKCNPADKFNLAFGTALAVARAYGDKETEAKLLAEPSEPVKEEPKFKVGELVRIRQWDDMEKEFGLTMLGSIRCGSIRCRGCFADGMKYLCGKYAEIVGLYKYGTVELKFFNCDGLNTDWAYSTDMIEKV